MIVEHTLADWKWVLGVNLWGVIHGVHTFLPIMLQQDTEGHVINVASVEGLWSRIGTACYQVSKHGVVVLSEVLKLEMAFLESKIGVSVLCPGEVNTGILDSGRNRPVALENPQENIPEPTPEQEEQWEALRKMFEEGMSPAEVADHAFKAIREDRFYILTHPDFNETIKKRLDRILSDGVPLPEYTLSNMPVMGVLSSLKGENR
jgi:NADP-dependent 3-hydroxy acid dehydrogenase YdfG